MNFLQKWDCFIGRTFSHSLWEWGNFRHHNYMKFRLHITILNSNVGFTLFCAWLIQYFHLNDHVLIQYDKQSSNHISSPHSHGVGKLFSCVFSILFKVLNSAQDFVINLKRNIPGEIILIVIFVSCVYRRKPSGCYCQSRQYEYISG